MKNRVDPETELQERADWLTRTLAWLVVQLAVWLPLVPLLLFYAAILAVAVAVIIHYLITPVV
jgi:hypothetical protein